MENINVINTITTLIGLALIGAALFHWIKNYSVNKTITNPAAATAADDAKYEKILFGILLFLAFAVRIWQFGSIPGGMNQDGAMAAVDAKALADYASDRYGTYMPAHFTAWGYGQMSVLLSYLMVPFIKIFGLTTVTARLPILLASIGGIVAAYFLFRRIFGIRAAQIVMAFLILNPWHYMQSRWALDCNMLPHMFIIGLFFLLKGLDEKKRYLYISMLFFALCMYSYGIAFYTVPVFLLVFCVYVLIKKLIRVREALISVGVYFLISWPIYLTMFINTAGMETIKTPFVTIPFFPDSVRSQDILFFVDNKGEQLISNIKSLVHIFIEGDTLPWNTITGFGTIFLCFVPFIFLGMYYVCHIMHRETDVKRKAGLLGLLLFFGIGILAGLITSNVNVNRINIILYPMILFASVGIYFVYLNIKRPSFSLGAVYLLMGCLFIHSYFTDYAENIRYIFMDGFIQSVQDVSKHSSCDMYCITPDSQYEGSSNVSEILTLFALQIDAKYYQGETKDGERPYAQTYYYCRAADTEINAQAPIAYVISNSELELFPMTEYHIETHDGFSSAIPKNFYKP